MAAAQIVCKNMGISLRRELLHKPKAALKDRF